MKKAKGIVAAGHPETAKAAAQILGDGGNAFDAALAGMAAACVTEPVLASLGGGGFLMARSPKQSAKPRLYDFFAEVPRDQKADHRDLDFFPIHADFGDTTQEFHIGLGSVATPGCLYGLFAIHRDLGHMPLADILAPAISYAKEGVIVNDLQARIFAIVDSIYGRTEKLRAVYGSPDGKAIMPSGHRFCLPDYADFLDVLAVEGEDLVRRGEVAQLIASACRDGGGLLSLDDLRHYEVRRREPQGIDCFGQRLWTNPAPSAGGTLISFGLKLLESLHSDHIRFGGGVHLCLLADVFKATQQARLDHRSSSPEADDNSALEKLLEPELLAKYQKSIMGQPASHRGTTQISIIAADGSAASLTLSNGEGSGHIVDGTGVMLNNMLGEDDINPDGFHKGFPGVRLSSMMAPSLVEGPDGALMALGSGGSNRIRTALVQTLYNVFGLAMPLDAAIAASRLHLDMDAVDVEPGLPEEGYEALKVYCSQHQSNLRRWEDQSMFFGGVHAVKLNPRSKAMDGFGDPRRGGFCLTV